VTPGGQDQPVERHRPPRWSRDGSVQRVIAALEAGGAAPRFVGGCVRDWLLRRPIRDIDVATPAEPGRVVALLRGAGLKVVPTGVEHGTVTAVSDGRAFEITTLRRDVETDGRRAVVAFTADWREDAGRRDFTINALSLAPDGSLYDYFGGRQDLAARRVRFIGEAAERIAEDHLRLLRFFRFHAWYGRGPLDPAGLAAATAAAPLLARLSGERLRAELLRLLEAPRPQATLRAMARHAILAAVLPGPLDVRTLSRLCRLLPRRRDPLLRLAALLSPGAETVEAVAGRLRFSRVERRRLAGLLDPAGEPDQPLELRRALHRLGPDLVRDRLLLRAARTPGPLAPPSALAEVDAWQPLPFPLTGEDLLAAGVPKGPELGRMLRALEEQWLAEDRRPDRAALLQRLTPPG